MDSLSWMAWTLPTGLFFAAIATLLAVYTALGLARPSLPRKGFLPMPTTRGDRLFVALLGTAFLQLAWAGLSDAPQWGAAILSLPFVLVVGRWG